MRRRNSVQHLKGNPKPIAEMSGPEINKALDRLDKLDSKFTEDMIAAGRGYERFSDWSMMTDPLALHGLDLFRQRMALRAEMERRYGPGTPGRLPKGFGPIRSNPQSDAAHMFEKFHGEPSGETVEFEQREHYHANLAALGVLVGLKVRSVSGDDVALIFDSEEQPTTGNQRRKNGIEFDRNTGLYQATYQTDSGTQYVPGSFKTRKAAQKAAGEVIRAFGKFKGRFTGEEENPTSTNDIARIHSKLASAVTQYDMKEQAKYQKALAAGKRGYYNMYALPQMLGKIQEHVIPEIERGVEVRKAVTSAFTGRLLDVALKAVGEAKSTREEQRNPKQGPFGAAMSAGEQVTRYAMKPVDKLYGEAGKVTGYLDRKLGKVLWNPTTKPPQPGEYIVTVMGTTDRPYQHRFIHDYVFSSLERAESAYAQVGPFIKDGRKMGNVAVVKLKMVHGDGTIENLRERFVERKTNPEFSSLTLLTSNEAGSQLYFTGGDQSIDLAVFKIQGASANKEFITLGELWALNYRTSKTFDDGPESADYVHILGRKETKPPRGGDLWDDAVPPNDKVFGSGELPTLIYDRLNKQLKLSGGMYNISKPLIGTSPGIEG